MGKPLLAVVLLIDRLLSLIERQETLYESDMLVLKEGGGHVIKLSYTKTH